MNKTMRGIAATVSAVALSGTLTSVAHAADWGISVEHGATSCPGLGVRAESFTIVNESGEVRQVQLHLTRRISLTRVRYATRTFTLAPGQQVHRSVRVLPGRVREYTVGYGVGLVDSFSIAGCGAASQ